MQYKHGYTNCISLTEDANVAQDYSENIGYVIVKVPKEQLEDTVNGSEKIVDARVYFITSIKKYVEDAIKETGIETTDIISKIEGARSNEELDEILRDLEPEISRSFLYERQYFDGVEELEYHKLLAKLKFLEANGNLENIIDGVDNGRLLMAVGNALTSAEYIHYGEIESEQIINCPSIFIEVLGLLQQARANGIDKNEFERLTKKTIDFIQVGYTIDENGILSNGEEKIDFGPEIGRFIQTDYSKKDNMNQEVTIDEAFAITQGNMGYAETRMQITSIRALVEMELHKRALVQVLEKILPEEDIETVLKNTYCVNQEFMTKHNGRGHQLTNTVNILISEQGIDLEKEHVKSLIEQIENLSQEQLIEIYTMEVQSKELQQMLIKTKDDDERINSIFFKSIDTQYMIEAIIEGYDWSKTRRLNSKEKNNLARKIATGVKNGDLQRLYNNLSQLKPIGRKKQFSQEEIFAIIMNIAMEQKLGNNSYNELLEASDELQKEILNKNCEFLQTTIVPISIDLMTNDDKAINKIKQQLIDLGIPKVFVDEKDVRNLYMAQNIVNDYNWQDVLGRELFEKEKRSIIQSILDLKLLSNDNSNACLLSSLMVNLMNIDLDVEDARGVIINLAINRSVISEPEHGYHDLVSSAKKVYELEGKEINSKVSKETVRNAIVEYLLPEEQIEFMRNDLRNRIA